jgi:hypothetical protein
MAAYNSAYRLPICINNKGAELLTQGKIKESRVLLLNALQCAKKIAITLRRQNINKSDINQSETVDFHFLIPIPLAVESETFVFTRPVQILEMKELVGCQAFAGEVTSAIVFNISLGFHAEGIRESKQLAKALRGYEIALGLRQYRRRVTSPLLDMGLFNNIAHIHVEMSAFENAWRCFSNMVHLMKRLDKTELDEVDLGGFQSGALWLLPTCAPVA